MIIVLMDVSQLTPKGYQRRQIYIICRHGATRRLRDLKTYFAILESCHPFGIGSMTKIHIGFIA